MLSIERNVVLDGHPTKVDMVSFDAMAGFTVARLAYFDVITVELADDPSQTCRIIGFARWSKALGKWMLESFTVFRPNLCIDALNLAAYRQHGVPVDHEYFVVTSSFLDVAEREALATLTSHARSGDRW